MFRKLITIGLITSSLLLSGCGEKNHESDSLSKLMKDESANAGDKLKEKESEVRIKKSYVLLEQKKRLSLVLEELSSIDGKMYFFEGRNDIEIGGIKNLKIDSFENLNNILKTLTNFELVITKNKLFADLPKVVVLKEIKESSILDDLQVGQNSLVMPSKLLSSISTYANGWKIDYKNNLKTTINNSDVVDFNGSAREFIEFYAKTNDLFVDWDYKNKLITLSKYKQKILRLQTSGEKYAFTNNIEVDLNNSSNSSSSSSSNSSNSSKSGVELKSSYDIMDNFKKLVTTIIPVNTSEEYINLIEDTGHIAVSTTPTKLSQLEDIIKKLNGDAFKQVFIKVTLIETDLSNAYQNGINWSYVKDALAVSGDNSVISAGINSQVAGSDTSLNAGTFLKYRSNIKDIGAVVKLLNTFGDTAVSFQNSGITTNNLPVIYNVSNTKGYVSEFKVESLGSGNNATVAPTQDSVTGGSYLYIKPSMVDDNITLSLKMVTSRINPFIRQEFQNGQYVQSKDIDKKLFSQNIVMKSGEKIIIGGIVQKTVQNSYQGLAPDQGMIGSSLLGVKDKAYATKEIAVMLEVEEI